MKVPHGIPVRAFIDWVNFESQDEARRCRLLLAEVLLRLEKLEPVKISGHSFDKIFIDEARELPTKIQEDIINRAGNRVARRKKGAK